MYRVGNTNDFVAISKCAENATSLVMRKPAFLQYMQWGRSAMVQADQGLLPFVALILSVICCFDTKCNDLFISLIR